MEARGTPYVSALLRSPARRTEVTTSPLLDPYPQARLPTYNS